MLKTSNPWSGSRGLVWGSFQVEGPFLGGSENNLRPSTSGTLRHVIRSSETCKVLFEGLGYGRSRHSFIVEVWGKTTFLLNLCLTAHRIQDLLHLSLVCNSSPKVSGLHGARAYLAPTRPIMVHSPIRTRPLNPNHARRGRCRFRIRFSVPEPSCRGMLGS